MKLTNQNKVDNIADVAKEKEKATDDKIHT